MSKFMKRQPHNFLTNLVIFIFLSYEMFTMIIKYIFNYVQHSHKDVYWLSESF